MADQGSWFALVDCARDPRLFGLVRRARRAECLFSGDLSPDFAAAAPHLVVFDRREPLFETWQKEGGGQNWGLFAQSTLPFDQLRRKFKKLLNAKLPNGQVVLFRFWDPRVFNPFVRACTEAERKALFAGVSCYMVEGDDGKRHRFAVQGNMMQVA